MNRLNTIKSTWRKVGLQRLFWRIFFSFWLSSLAIMFATTYVITGEFESEQRLKSQKKGVKKYAKSIIKKYEKGQDISLLLIKPSEHKSVEKPQKKPPPILSIYNDQQNLIFGPPHYENIENGVKSSVKGKSGLIYSVYSRKFHMNSFMKDAIYQLNSIQLIFILIVSTLVSALLSWSIASPLKRLSHFSQHYAKKSGTLKIDDALLKRKDEIGDLASDISNMMAQIEYTLSSQRQLLHDVSHELRAPLSRLQVSVALIEQQSSDHSQTKRIHSELQRINLLIQQILDYSRQEEQVESKTNINLVTLVNKITNTLKTQFPLQRFSISSNENAIEIKGYESSLISAFENILVNACKHTQQEMDIQVGIQKRNDDIIITVKNYGENIEQAELTKLLQPFYRAGNKMHTEGFGLGLSIANKAIQKHNGKLNIDNHPDGGVVVTCKLPIT